MRLSLPALVAALALAVGATPGCVYAPTEVLVYLDTNAPESRQLTITATVRAGSATTGPGTTMTWIRGAVIDGGVQGFDAGLSRFDAGFVRRDAGLAPTADAGISLPATFGIVPGDGPRDGPVTLVVEASLAGARPLDAPTVFRRIARFALTSHAQTVVRVFLAVECGAPTTGCTGVAASDCTVSALCEQRGETCGEHGLCVPRDIPPVPYEDAGLRDVTDIQTPVSRMDAAVTDVPAVDARDVQNAQDAQDAQDVQASDVRPDVPCGGPCPAGPNQTAACVMGSCQRMCNPGFGDCNAMPADGCETDLSASLANCGQCGMACRVPANATARCGAGVCSATCNAPFDDCNANPADGCETDTQSTVSACGGCGRVCAPPNASPLCAGGACGYGACNTGFTDLDGDRGNGCECGNVPQPTDCGSAHPLGALAVGGSASAGGNILAGAESHWFTVDFAPGGDARIQFATNPGGTFRIEVRDTCGAGPRACGEGGSATGITDWQFNDSNVVPLGGTTRNEPFPTTVVFRVYNSGGTTCAGYSVQASN